MDIFIFKRYEKKYRISKKQKNRILSLIGDRLYEDEHGKSTVCSLYLDTPSHLLIRNSIDAKDYKEKLRIRSYNVPSLDARVFLEIKKKYKGIVYKRRVSLSLAEAYAYIDSLSMPFDSQITREIDYAMRLYSHPRPSMLIAYEREAYFSNEDKNLRITFDSGVRFREDDLFLEKGNHGTYILEPDEYIMEIKTGGAMPLWLSRMLSENEIFPSSFSKYGKSYLKVLKGEI